jgi:site-specific DNA-methyltransferase (adenine-specific)
VWTDPPYGVNQSTDHLREWDGGAKRPRSAHGIQNDAMTPEDTATLWADAFEQLQRVSEPGAAWYSSGPQGMQGIGWQGCKALDLFGMKRTLIWVKNSLVMGRSDYHYRHEPIYYGWFEGAARLHPVPSASCSVFECPRPTASTAHPTMKPVDLIRPMIENSTGANWLVGDPFGGSGSTLIACAMTGRRARLIEIDPRYCDVIRRRWTTWAKTHDQEPGPGALE